MLERLWSTPSPEHRASGASSVHSRFPRAFGSAFQAAAKVQVARWDRALGRVEEEQERVLRSIVSHSAGTEFGRLHDFGAIRRYQDYARLVPLGDYDAFSPYIERMRKGERGLLVPETVRYFANSSGSSTQGRPKFLPITETQIRHQRRAGADTLMRWMSWAKEPSFVRGFTIGLFPPTTMKREGASYITSNPALMVSKLPLLTRPVYLPHDDIRRLTDYDTKLDAIAARYLDWDVRAVAGTTCWFPVLFEKVLAAARRRGRDVRSVSEVWPNLRVLLGGGVTAEPYQPVLRGLVGRDITLVDTYNATEGGIYASTDFSGARGMLMLPHRGTFFEFVPLDERDHPSPSRVPLWAVEKDRAYSIVVTTTSGLFAYEVGDIVRFPSVRPLRIEFMGRLSGCLSVTQELTTHVEIERAVAHAIEKCRSRTVDFAAAADVGVDGGAKSRYLLFVEFDEGAAPADLAAFGAAFDEGLGAENRVYREHRLGDVAILPPKMVSLVSGGARRFLEQTTHGNVQGKFPRILDEAKKMKLFAYAREQEKVVSR